MKKSFLLLVSVFIFSSCSKPEEIVDNQILEFSIERINSPDNYFSKVKSYKLISDTKSFSQYALADSSNITQELVFKVELQNGKNINFSIWMFKANVANQKLDFLENSWDYASKTDANNEFYGQLDEVRIIIDNTYFYTLGGLSQSNITIKTNVVNDNNAISLDLIFKGTASPFYGIFGDGQGDHVVSNGKFFGIF
ncbi:MAG: hypothetical protein IPL23_00360 [Saprospiraceae bacterium]|nr:hypothetical protein [Saprospiraceae bacterium]MBK8634402.1 hypothetical protein [Saprospiraceae bacterium]MBP7642205.1 hypothetical protein [Saprospiraceae bacterium]